MGNLLEYGAKNEYADNRDVISLFSGAMGLDIGLEKAGLNVVIGQDFDESCVKTMQANGHNVLGGDIRQIDPRKLLELTGRFYRRAFPDLWRATVPTVFNRRKRLGINDPRGSLFMDFIRMIDYIRPRFFCHGKCKRNYVSSFEACSFSRKRRERS